MSRVAEGRLRREKEWEEAPSTGLPVGTGWGRAGSGGPGEFTRHCCGCHTPAPRLSREPAAKRGLRSHPQHVMPRCAISTQILSSFSLFNVGPLLGISLCFVFLKKITYLYLAASGLSCGVTDLHFGTRAYLPRDMWDLSSSTRDRTWVPCLGKWILNHWTTREVPLCGLLSMSLCEMLPSTSAHILLAVWISFVNGLLGNLGQFALGLPVLFLLIFMYSG